MTESRLFRRIYSDLQRSLLWAFLLFFAVLLPLQWFSVQEASRFHRQALIQSIRDRLMAVANSGTLLLSNSGHANIFQYYDYQEADFQKLQKALIDLGQVNGIKEEIYTLRLESEEKRLASFVVMTGVNQETKKPYIGTTYEFPDSMLLAFKQGQTVVTDIYRSRSLEGELWMSVFAPFKEEEGEDYCVLEVDISVGNLLAQVEIRRNEVMLREGAKVAFVFFACIFLWLALGRILKLAVSKHVAEPTGRFTDFITGVEAGRLIGDLDLNTKDELQDLADSFNHMVSRLASSLQELSTFNDKLALEVRQKTFAIRRLLDNAGQGFLSFGPDFLVHAEYSLECEKIFSRSDVSGVLVSELLNLPDPEAFSAWMSHGFADAIDFQVIQELAPKEFICEARSYSLQWQKISDGDSRVLMLILTNVTEQKRLQEIVEREEAQIRKVLRVLSAPQEYTILIHEVETLVLEHGLLAEELFRRVHTCKGAALGMELNALGQSLHAYEDSLQKGKSEPELLQGVRDSLQMETQALKDILGTAYPSGEIRCQLSHDLYQELLLAHPKSTPLGQRLHGLMLKPLRSYFSRYPVAASELADKLEKMVRFEIHGGEFLVAEEPFQELSTLLMHCLRNMIDHGIESIEEREDSGKDGEGACSLTLAETSDGIELTFSDDGRGIDPMRLRPLLLDKKLISPLDLQRLSDSEVQMAIFWPGFSTRQEVSEISGRGIGMDAVKSRVSELGGTVTLHSQVGIGTTIKVFIPIPS